MASQIINWGLDGDKAIEMVNSHFARSLSIGNDWQKLRVGLRLSFKESSSIDVAAPSTFFFGLSHGSSSVFGDSHVSHSVGAITWNDGWSDTGTGLVSNRWGIAVRSGSAPSTIYGNSGGHFSVTQSCRDPHFIDFVRTSSATGSIIHCSLYYHYYGELTDCNQSTFYHLMENDSVDDVSFGAQGYVSNVGDTIIIREDLYGTLDSVCVSWNKSYPTAVINDIAVYKFA